MRLDVTLDSLHFSEIVPPPLVGFTSRMLVILAIDITREYIYSLGFRIGDCVVSFPTLQPLLGFFYSGGAVFSWNYCCCCFSAAVLLLLSLLCPFSFRKNIIKI